MKKNKILIVPGNTDLNRGDQALVWESIRLMDEVLADTEVYLYEVGANELEKNKQKAQTEKLGYVFLTRILQHPRGKNKKTQQDINYSRFIYLKWGLTASKDLLSTTLLLSSSKTLNKMGKRLLSSEQRKSLEIFPTLKALVIKGGGFLHSYGKVHDAYTMYFFLFDLMLAHKYKVKTIVLPNSIGPLRNELARKLVQRVLKKSAYVSLREEVSANYVNNELNISAKKYPDLGFFLQSADDDMTNYLSSLGFDHSAKNVAITLRPYRFDGYDNPEVLYQQYLDEISKFIKELINKDYKISLVAHTLGPSAHEDDRLALRDVYNSLEENLLASVLYLEDNTLNCRQIQKIYSYYDILVGTRFHSVIFALNVNVPSIAIAYGGNKSYGIMSDIGVSDYVMGIESVNAKKLTDLVTQLEHEKEEYKTKLQVYQKDLEMERKKIIKEIKDEF